MIPNWEAIMAERVRVVESYGAARPFAIELHIKDKKFKIADFMSLEEAHKASQELMVFLKETFGELCTETAT